MALRKGHASKAIVDAINANTDAVTTNTAAITALQAKFTTAPGSASATGTAGQIATDTGYVYVCTATNTWKRVAVSTW